MNNQSEEVTHLRIPCRHLRSKEMFYHGEGPEHEPYASDAFWCTKTHETFGPDGQPAVKVQCCAGRSCFVG